MGLLILAYRLAHLGSSAHGSLFKSTLSYSKAVSGFRWSNSLV